MPESMIGTWLYVCNCGPGCRCSHHSEGPSSCPCGDPSAPRRVLAEDERSFYVAETGHADAVDELGAKPFTTVDGRPLQPFKKKGKVFATFAEVIQCLNDFYTQRTPPVHLHHSPHKDFWSALTPEQFLTGNVPNVTDDAGNPIRICVPGDGEKSAIVQALRGAAGTVFDPDTGSFGRMPADSGPYLDATAIQAISDWISKQKPS